MYFFLLLYLGACNKLFLNIALLWSALGRRAPVL